jgi:homoaconitase/3-isopropylmalate dehydratase large subunit
LARIVAPSWTPSGKCGRVCGITTWVPASRVYDRAASHPATEGAAEFFRVGVGTAEQTNAMASTLVIDVLSRLRIRPPI